MCPHIYASAVEIGWASLHFHANTSSCAADTDKEIAARTSLGAHWQMGGCTVFLKLSPHSGYELLSSCLPLSQMLRLPFCLFVCPELTLTCLSKVMEPSIEQIDQDVTYKTVNQSAIKTESYGRGATLKWWGNCYYLKLLKSATFADFTLLVFISTAVAAGWLLSKARMRTAEG